MQRYCPKTGGLGTDFFALNGLFSGNLRTKKLNNYVFKYANRLSYAALCENLSEIAHLKTTSAGLERAVIIEAEHISAENAQEMSLRTVESPLSIAAASEIDIYSPRDKEILLFYDAICVKKQCPFRKNNPNFAELSATKSKLLKRVNTNVAVLQLPDNQFIKLTEGLASKDFPAYSTIELVAHTLRVNYAQEKEPLHVVGITDGASSIRTDFTEKLSPLICIILDWYHLKKKIKDLMSMIAINKIEKSAHIKLINNLLWHGKTDEVITYLATINVKNTEVLEQLITYLEKHKAEIIDYDKRKKAGKTIGSGRGEKANDQLIGRRQKHKGIAWSDNGSKALAIIATKYA